MVGSGQPGPRLTRGGQPLLSRVSCVHGAVTEQGPSLSPALSPTWHTGRAQPQKGRRELVREAKLGPPPTNPALPACPGLAQSSETGAVSVQTVPLSTFWEGLGTGHR